MQLDQNNLVGTADIHGPVFQHQGISNHSAEYTPMHFQLIIG